MFQRNTVIWILIRITDPNRSKKIRLKIAARVSENWQSYGLYKFDLKTCRLITLASVNHAVANN